MPQANTNLQIVPSTHTAALTPAQKRFNTLIAQIGRARTTLAAWHENVGLYRQADAGMLEPLRGELNAANRRLAFALEDQLTRHGWTKAEKRALHDLILEIAGTLLDALESGDEELKSLYARHSDTDYDTEQHEMTLTMKSLTEALTGMDLGDDADIRNQDDLMQRLHAGMAQEDQDKRAAREAHAGRRRMTAAEKRQATEANEATRSVREIYRKLASALHPDREPDEAQRGAKTALMQRVNQAYAAQDLLALLELQLEIEQIDTGHLAGASEQRLKHYNKVLAEQAAQIKQEIEVVEAQFRMEFDLFDVGKLQPSRIGELIQREKQTLNFDLVSAQRDAHRLADVQATKRWLKQQRQAMREAEYDLPF